MRAGPDFICIGPPRCGTRYLYDALRATPGVWMPPVKEVDFWSRPPAEIAAGVALQTEGRIAALNAINHLIAAYVQGAEVRRDLDFCRRYVFDKPRTLDWYCRLFDLAGGEMTGDITPGYCSAPVETVALVKRAFPDVVVVAIHRDPAEQAWSLFNTAIRYGRAPESGRNDPGVVAAWIEAEMPAGRIGPGALAHWRDAFPGMITIDFAALIERPGEAVAAIARATGRSVGATPAPANVKAGHTPPMNGAIRQVLERRLFHHDVGKADVGNWKSAPEKREPPTQNRKLSIQPLMP